MAEEMCYNTELVFFVWHLIYVGVKDDFLSLHLCNSLLFKELGLCTSGKKTIVKAVLPKKEKKEKKGMNCLLNFCLFSTRFISLFLQTYLHLRFIRLDIDQYFRIKRNVEIFLLCD